ncbi:hypothetical protein [Azospirillum sp.]|uniref:hypothetical protein n=1 Tax=Azospirillum sp. TaxID=34012 RepID=UPI002D3594D4|nr:hypothetical protein [Azospirillum sp.]HYD64990.1 hypothetical protein [Azospirillum sp.]
MGEGNDNHCRRRYTLRELLTGSAFEEMRTAFDCGPDVGREVIDEVEHIGFSRKDTRSKGSSAGQSLLSKV